MSRITVELGLEDVMSIVFQLPGDELLILADEIDERAGTVAMMKLAETGFAEWNEPGEEIYDEPSSSR